MNLTETFGPAIKTFVQSNEKAMFTLLEELVCIQSGSHNKQGVDAVGKRIEAVFDAMAVKTEVIEQPMLGNHRIARTASPPGEKGQIFMVGHMDTVFPADTDFNWYREDRDNCYGPGVTDMKGGLVILRWKSPVSR